MDIYVYSDESGVFDKDNNDFFVYGGLMFLSKNDHENWKRKYLNAERTIRKIERLPKKVEVKATAISNSSKGKLYRSLNHTEKFGVVVHEKKVHPKIYTDKKSKQRYLDYVYKIGVKRKFENLISRGLIIPEEVENIYFFVDEHNTATNGIYELQEGLEQEFKKGTYNYNWQTYFPPIFSSVCSVRVNYCNSEKKTLIRSADIIANRLRFYATQNNLYAFNKKTEINVVGQP
ncbi:DUF3800 domain-containing protein [Limosilactobacillus fermentum]